MANQREANKVAAALDYHLSTWPSYSKNLPSGSKDSTRNRARLKVQNAIRKSHGGQIQAGVDWRDDLIEAILQEVVSPRKPGQKPPFGGMDEKSRNPTMDKLMKHTPGTPQNREHRADQLRKKFPLPRPVVMHGR